MVLDLFDRYGSKISKLFGMILLLSIIAGSIISYNNNIQLQLGIKYLRSTFNQSSTNYDLINQNHKDHLVDFQYKQQINKQIQIHNQLLNSINKTLGEIVNKKNQTS